MVLGLKEAYIMSQKNPMTAKQIGKFIQMLDGVSADAFQVHGFQIAHLFATYLRQETPKPFPLGVMCQVLGISSPGVSFVRVSWTKTIPSKRLSDSAIRPGGQRKMWTTLARIFPQDVGLVSENVSPVHVLDLALEWGFRRIPLEAYRALLHSDFDGQTKAGGDAMAYMLSEDDTASHRCVAVINNPPRRHQILGGAVHGTSSKAASSRSRELVYSPRD